jgi:hypothetical protein
VRNEVLVVLEELVRVLQRLQLMSHESTSANFLSLSFFLLDFCLCSCLMFGDGLVNSLDGRLEKVDDILLL